MFLEKKAVSIFFNMKNEMKSEILWICWLFLVTLYLYYLEKKLNYVL